MSDRRPLDAHVLREEFDRAFAAAPPEAGGETTDLIAIRAGGAALAFRLSELTGLLARPAIVPLPGGPEGLLGLAGVRGRLVPVYGLSRLLCGADEEPRWLALAGPGLGLAFAELEGFLRQPSAALRRSDGGEAHLPELLDGTPPRGVLDLDIVTALARRRAGLDPEENPE